MCTRKKYRTPKNAIDSSRGSSWITACDVLRLSLKRTKLDERQFLKRACLVPQTEVCGTLRIALFFKKNHPSGLGKTLLLLQLHPCKSQKPARSLIRACSWSAEVSWSPYGARYRCLSRSGCFVGPALQTLSNLRKRGWKKRNQLKTGCSVKSAADEKQLFNFRFNYNKKPAWEHDHHLCPGRLRSLEILGRGSSPKNLSKSTSLKVVHFAVK